MWKKVMCCEYFPDPLYVNASRTLYIAHPRRHLAGSRTCPEMARGLFQFIDRVRGVHAQVRNGDWQVLGKDLRGVSTHAADLNT